VHWKVRQQCSLKATTDLLWKKHPEFCSVSDHGSTAYPWPASNVHGELAACIRNLPGRSCPREQTTQRGEPFDQAFSAESTPEGPVSCNEFAGRSNWKDEFTDSTSCISSVASRQACVSPVLPCCLIHQGFLADGL